MPEPEARAPRPSPCRSSLPSAAAELPPRGPRTPVTPPRSNGRRPAGAPRGRAGRRVLAVLALALIGGALYLINATFQPFHDDPTGAVAVNVPAGADAGQIGNLLARRGGDRQRAPVRGQRDDHAAARPTASRQVHAARRG